MENNVDPLRDQEQQKVLEVVKENNFHGLLDLTLRFGKTRVGILAIEEMFNRLNRLSIPVSGFLWVTPDVNLRDVDIPNDFKKFGKEHLLKHIDIICYNSLKNETKHRNLIILDEYQHITMANMYSFLTNKISYNGILGFTGTKPRNRDKAFILDTLRLRSIYTVSMEDAVGLDLISNFVVKVIKYDLPYDEAIVHRNLNKKIDALWEQTKDPELLPSVKNSARKSAIHLGRRRTKLIYESKRKLEVTKFLKESLKDKRGLIFLPRKAMVEQFDSYYHSTSGNEHYLDFKQNKKNHLVLVKAGGTGHTYGPMDFVIVGQITRDITGLTTQAWGRGLMKKGHPLEVYILCAKGTVEEQWVQSTLENIEDYRVEYVEYTEVVNDVENS